MRRIRFRRTSCEEKLLFLINSDSRLPVSSVLVMIINSLLIRTAAILLHAAVNFLLVTWFISYDVTGKWIYFIGFTGLLLVLLYFFIRHLISFIYFLKTKTK